MPHFKMNRNSEWYKHLTRGEARQVEAFDVIIESVDRARASAVEGRLAIQRVATYRKRANDRRIHSEKFRG